MEQYFSISTFRYRTGIIPNYVIYTLIPHGLQTHSSGMTVRKLIETLASLITRD